MAVKTGTGIHDLDEQRLAELGYKQELDRSWSGFQNFAISFTIISILAGCFTTYGQAWNNGGPIAISWGWPLISIPILIIGFCMSELVSAYPTAGGIYWWASKLGGPAWGWFTGWFNLIGLVAVTASVDYGCATFMNVTFGAFNFNLFNGVSGDFFSGTFWLFVVILAFHALVNIAGSHLVARINGISVWWHVLGVAGDPGRPDHRPRQARVGGLRLHPALQQLGLPGQHVLVLRAPARLPADAVHDHRLRLLRAHLRGDPRRSRQRRQGRVALDLLLGALRLGPAAGHHLRGHQRRRRQQGRGGRRLRRGLDPPARAGHRVVQARARHLHGRAALLRRRVPDQLVAHVLRVQPRRRHPRLAHLEQGELDADPVQRRDLHGRVRRAHHRPGVLAGGQRRAGGLLRRRLDRGDRPVHRLRDPDLPALADGRRVRDRALDARAQVQVDEPVRHGLGRVHHDHLHPADEPRRRAVERRVRLEARQLRPAGDGRGDPRRGHLVAASARATPSPARATRSRDRRGARRAARQGGELAPQA